MSKRTILEWWSASVGAMDAVTGLLLVACPGLVLGLLRIDAPQGEALLFLRWIGVFVMAVGLCYGLAFCGGRRGEAAWIFTALVRMMVAGFLFFQVMAGMFEGPWLAVAGADGAVALVQALLLGGGWWREVPG